MRGLSSSMGRVCEEYPSFLGWFGNWGGCGLYRPQARWYWAFHGGGFSVGNPSCL